MWALKGPSERLIYLKLNETMTIGRKNADIVLNDESVSRAHASITVTRKEDQTKLNEPTSTCILKDTNSKYGTYMYLQEIELGDKPCILAPDDKIRFGMQEQIFTVIYIPIITLTSALNVDDKHRLQNIMNAIGGTVTSVWVGSCTHLTVSAATLTEKLTLALASGVPIVKMDYWEAVKSAIENAQEFPDPLQFAPPIGEKLIHRKDVSLSPDRRRRTLFKDLIFIHFTAGQYRTYGKMINIAGGMSVLYSKRPLDIEYLCSPNVVVLQDSTDATQSINAVPEYNSICEALRKSRHRMIPESEIPLAILYCSVEKYCNPKFNFGSFLSRRTQCSDSKRENSTSEQLALDTQDVCSRSQPKMISNILIKPSFAMRASVKQSQDTDRRNFIPESSDYTCEEDRQKDKEHKNDSVTTKRRNYIPETLDSDDNSNADATVSKHEDQVPPREADTSRVKKSTKNVEMTTTMTDTVSKFKEVFPLSTDNMFNQMRSEISENLDCHRKKSVPEIEIVKESVNLPIEKSPVRSKTKLENAKSDSKVTDKNLKLLINDACTEDQTAVRDENLFDRISSLKEIKVVRKESKVVSMQTGKRCISSDPEPEKSCANTKRRRELLILRQKKVISREDTKRVLNQSPVDEISQWNVPNSGENTSGKSSEKSLEILSENSSQDSVENSSFVLRREPGRKTFKKTYKKIPQSMRINIDESFGE